MTLDAHTYDIENKIMWCPGCGNFGMLQAVKRALADLGLEQHQFAIFWGIGQHGNGADYIKVQGFHALHGRALPTATGFALTNPEMKVIVQSGDGDGYGLGMSHFVHGIRRNLDMTYIAHDNQIYGLTTGQASPTSNQGMRTPSTPHGVLEWPINPIGVALAQGATFVARGFAGDIAHMKELFTQAIQHKGFALVDVFQPCVTFNKENTFSWYKARAYKLEDEPDYAPNDRLWALGKAEETLHIKNDDPPEHSRIPVGVFYREERATYQDGLPQLADGPLWKRSAHPREIAPFVEAFM